VVGGRGAGNGGGGVGGDSLTGGSKGGAGVEIGGGWGTGGADGALGEPLHQTDNRADPRSRAYASVRGGGGRMELMKNLQYAYNREQHTSVYIVYVVKLVRTLACAVLLWLAPTPAWAQTADDIFNGTAIQRVDLFPHSSDWAKLKADFQSNTYYPADLVLNGQTVRGIGIRSRGRGSRSSSKPGLRVDIDHYSPGQTFFGLKSFILDNGTQDASGIHEPVAAALYARLGIPVSREIHTRLFVNNEYVGVYVIVESVDKDLLARVFGAIGEDTQNDGYLFEFKWQDDWRFSNLGSGLEPYKARFEATTHESNSDEQKYRLIETLVRRTNESSASGIANEIGGLLDIPAFIRYVAAQNFLADTDGFLGAFGMNNFYLYRLENRDLHTLISWDSDNTFYATDLSITEGWAGNVLMEKLMSVPEFNQLYLTEMARTVELAEQDNFLNDEIIRQVQRIDTAMKEDPAKPFSNATYEGSAGSMLSFARARIAFVKCELANGVGRCRQ
jgi:spore coat protein CotH